MKYNMIIETPANGSIATSLVCINCPMSIYRKDFGVDLIYLPLSKLYIILGINQLSFNHVRINFFNKTMLFLESKSNKDSRFISAN